MKSFFLCEVLRSDICVRLLYSGPSAKKMKWNVIEKKQKTKTKTVSISNCQEDPRALTDLPEDQKSAVPEYRRHWHQIRTRFKRQNRLLD